MVTSQRPDHLNAFQSEDLHFNMEIIRDCHEKATLENKLDVTSKLVVQNQ